MSLNLSKDDLRKLPRPIRKEPIFKPKIIHLGPGAFFRAFVASLIDEVNRKGVEKWGILAVSLNSESTFEKLAGQEFVFTSLVKSKTKKISNYTFILKHNSNDFRIIRNNFNYTYDIYIN